MSAALHGLLRPLKRRALECRAARCLPGMRPWLPIRHASAPAPDAPTAIVIHKHGGRVRDLAADTTWLASRNGFSTAWRRLGAILDLVADPAVDDGDWTADLGDWVHLDGPVIGFCSNRRESLLVPDRGFHGSGGYRQDRRRAAAAPAFADRDPRIVWRGSPTGQGAVVSDPLSADNPALRQRVRMCLLLRDLSGRLALPADARIVVGRGVPAPVADAFRRVDIAGGPVAQPSWCNRRFAIDIDGEANAFTNLFTRLVYGCCVIKVASPLGFRQWYYDRLEPWQHFVPVAADLSDLPDILAWCATHPRSCAAIAAAGQQVALAMTPATERSHALDILVTASRSGADERMVLRMPTRRPAHGLDRERRAA